MELIQEPTVSRVSRFGKLKNRLRKFSWLIFGLSCLIVFTVFKLPAIGFESLIQGKIEESLRPMGIQLSARESDISYGMGITYTMKRVMLSIPARRVAIRFKEVSFTPSFRALISGKLGGKAFMKTQTGEANTTFAFGEPSFDFSFDAKSIDLGQLGVLRSIAQIEGGGLLSGKGTFSGDKTDLSKLEGKIDATLSNVIINEQKLAALFGMRIPELRLSQAKLKARSENAQLMIEALDLGTPKDQSDDIKGKIDGKIDLAKRLRDSKHYLNAQFTLSDKVFGISGLIEKFMSPAKQSDGSYAYELQGSFFAPFPRPVKLPAKNAGK